MNETTGHRNALATAEHLVASQRKRVRRQTVALVWAISNQFIGIALRVWAWVTIGLYLWGPEYFRDDRSVLIVLIVLVFLFLGGDSLKFENDRRKAARLQLRGAKGILAIWETQRDTAAKRLEEHERTDRGGE